ncbi:MAG TPA: formate dehydrogenase subunit delta [Pararhizobium sp.]|jgi:formate dehydrogenase subunit delta|nr:formate dehydrogenase subunit delta [Pararhizobium sp.]
MSPDKLVHMANQIASFFHTLPHEDAAARTADHINKFWEPRMRRHLFEHMDKGGEGLDEAVMKARPLIHEASYTLDA